MQFRRRTAVLLLVVVGIFLYAQVVHNDFIAGDDEAQILNNPQVHSLANIPQLFLENTYFSQQLNSSYGLFYRPVTLSGYAVLYSLFGPNPGVFHLLQMLLHIINAILVFFIVESFFPVILSFILALTFLVHPINSEAVVLATNLGEILFFFFGSLALLAVIKASKVKLSSLFYILFLTLSIFSKETGLLYGFIAVVYTILFSKKLLRKVTISTVSVFLFYILFRFAIAKIGFVQNTFAPISHASFAVRLLNIPAIITRYLYEFIFPLQLQTAQLWMVKNANWSGFYLPLVILVILMFVSIFAYKRILYKRKKYALVFLFFSIWFVSGLLIHLQIIPLDLTLAEKWFYFPVVGLMGMMATIYYIVEPKNMYFRRSLFLIYVLVLLLFSFQTYFRIFDWHDSQTFFSHELQTDPHNFLTENYLGSIYLDKQNYKKATPLILDSFKQNPYLGNLNSMAIINAHNKKISAADYYFNEALHDGSTYSLYNNYANFLLYEKKDYRKAYEVANIGLQKYPDEGDLYLVKAQTEYAMGNKAQALKDAKTADLALDTPLSNEVFSAILFDRKIQIDKYVKY